jgi:hypothetical protein
MPFHHARIVLILAIDRSRQQLSGARRQQRAAEAQAYEDRYRAGLRAAFEQFQRADPVCR